MNDIHLACVAISDGKLVCDIDYNYIEDIFAGDVSDVVKLLRKAADSIEQCFSSDKDVVCLTRISLEKESIIPEEVNKK